MALFRVEVDESARSASYRMMVGGQMVRLSKGHEAKIPMSPDEAAKLPPWINVALDVNENQKSVAQGLAEIKAKAKSRKRRKN